MAISQDTAYNFGQLGSVFNDGTAAMKPPLGKVFVAITMLADTTFDSSAGLVADTTYTATEGLEYVGNTAAHNLGAGNATAISGEGGLIVDVSNVFPKGVTIYGRWTEVDLASGTVIAYMHNTQARSFDGSDQDVNIDGLIAEIADVVKTDETEFSISLWCKLSAGISSSISLFKCRNTGSSNNQVSLVYHAHYNEYRFAVKFGGVADLCNGGATNAGGASYEGDGIWHHLVGTVGVENNTTEFWIDNEKKESIAGVGTLNESINDASLFQNGTGGTYFDGDVKDVAIYGRQLTDDEIGIIYNARGRSGDKGIDLVSGSHVSNTGLIAHFRFEEKSGTVAINEAGANGTYVNAPAITTNIP